MVYGMDWWRLHTEGLQRIQVKRPDNLCRELLPLYNCWGKEGARSSIGMYTDSMIAMTQPCQRWNIVRTVGWSFVLKVQLCTNVAPTLYKVDKTLAIYLRIEIWFLTFIGGWSLWAELKFHEVWNASCRILATTTSFITRWTPKNQILTRLSALYF